MFLIMFVSLDMLSELLKRAMVYKLCKCEKETILLLFYNMGKNCKLVKICCKCVVLITFS